MWLKWPELGRMSEIWRIFSKNLKEIRGIFKIWGMAKEDCGGKGGDLRDFQDLEDLISMRFGRFRDLEGFQ